VRDQFGERRIPLIGVLAAFIFAAQMLNFPVAGGTSGHLVGAALAAVLLGPWAAAVTMTSVLAIQALMFQDGGLLGFGFNVVNMGLIGAFVGYGIYRLAVRGLGKRNGLVVGGFLGAWAAVVVSSAACAVELALSGSASLGLTLPVMIGIHSLIGLVEGAITAAALVFIRETRPDLLTDAPRGDRASRWIGVGLVIALAVTLFSPLASPFPDGLERVAIDQQFIEREAPPTYTLLPDYTVPFIEDATATTIVSGMIGVLAVAVVGYGLARLVKRART
jgi:cobalt/nickel transport system permease protein